MVKKRKKEYEADGLDEVVEQSEGTEQDVEDPAQLARLEQASTGIITDVRTLRLMYSEKCVLEAILQAQVQRNAYETRIQVLRNEMSSIVRQWEDRQNRIVRKIADLRREMEEDYGINMQQWAFDDETAVLQRLPQTEADQIDAEKDRSKLKEDATESEAPDRESGT